MTITEAAALAHKAIRRRCDAAGKPYPPMPAVVINRRMTTTAGRATYLRSAPLTHPYFKISLGKPWLASSPEGARETVIHEAMHVVDAWLHGRSSHGPAWMALMLAEGLRPARYCSDPGANAAANRARFARMRWLHCPCASHRVTRSRALLAARPGALVICRRCHQPTSTSHPTPEQVERVLQTRKAA